MPTCLQARCRREPYWQAWVIKLMVSWRCARVVIFPLRPTAPGAFLPHQQRCRVRECFVFATKFAIEHFVQLFYLAQVCIGWRCSGFAGVAELALPLAQLVLKPAFLTTPGVQRLVFEVMVSVQGRHPHGSERFTEPGPLKVEATPMQAMMHRLKTLASTAADGLRRQTLEPVFGSIKLVMGFRQCALRRLHKVTGELNLVCLAWNVKRIAVLRSKIG